MDITALNEIPAHIAANKLTPKEAANRIAELIYRFPYKFGLYRFDEDFRSELIVSFLQQAHVLFDRYDSAQGAFVPFLYAFIRGLILSELRVLRKEAVDSKSMKQEEANEYEQQMVRYAPDEVAATDEAYEFRPVIAPSKTYCVKNYCTYQSNVEEKTVLVLALKASYYLSDRHISLISRYCEVDRAALAQTVADLKAPLEKRVQNWERLRTRRDNSYYFHRTYAVMLNHQNETETVQAGLKARYAKQTANWLAKNRQIKKSCHRICPTNKTVARVLGICERQVSYYITRARRKVADGELYAALDELPSPENT
ncbi:MAG: hypothetical protein IJ191_06700 [Treponema sp.]|nr:hypothetical protein [Treponema sp.]